MHIEQIYTGCLAEATYYITSGGQAAIIDPLRETAPYLERLEKDGVQLKYILETHFHADFVSGHLDLAKKTGAQIVYGPTAQPAFEAYIAKDEEVLTLGDIQLKVLHTPGHTMESSTFLLIDENGREHAIFTGDTLFIGDVGRPDLAVKTDLTREELASHLYRSIHNKILPLPDHLMVYPGHGAGSACGKNMSKETTDLLGNQKQFNYALNKDLDEEAFVYEITDGLVPPPQYFPKNAVLNKQGYTPFDEVLAQGATALPLEKFAEMAENPEVLVLDTRHQDDFTKGHIPGSLYIGVHDNFAPWVGALVKDLHRPIIFLADAGKEEEVVTRLSRVGYDNAQGYLEGGFATWQQAGKAVDQLATKSAEGFAEMVAEKETVPGQLLDVRKVSEYDSQHLEAAKSFPLDFINQNLENLKADDTHYVHCAAGYRSVIASSILKAEGFKVINLNGGFSALSKTTLPTTAYTEPVSQL